MREQSIEEYILLGLKLRYLQDVKKGYPINGKSYVLRNIEFFLDQLGKFSLPVTRRYARKLEDIGSSLKGVKLEKLNDVYAERISQAAGDIREVLSAELDGRVVFVLTDKRLSVEKLFDDVPNLFPEFVFVALSKFAQFDFTEAGKCIALERPTAAAFHLLRGTEDILRHFYGCYVKRKKIKTLMWGPIVEDLRKKRNKPSTVLLDHLDHLRKNFRNPTQHPDKIYDMDEAQDLFGLCVEVVNRMVQSQKWTDA